MRSKGRRMRAGSSTVRQKRMWIVSVNFYCSTDVYKRQVWDRLCLWCPVRLYLGWRPYFVRGSRPTGAVSYTHLDVYKRQALSYLLHGITFEQFEGISGVLVIGISISLTMGAIFIPMVYLAGEDKTIVFLIISLICALGIATMLFNIPLFGPFILIGCSILLLSLIHILSKRSRWIRHSKRWSRDCCCAYLLCDR